jgi:hypothetical protein
VRNVIKSIAQRLRDDHAVIAQRFQMDARRLPIDCAAIVKL